MSHLEKKLRATVHNETQTLELLDKTFNEHFYARTKENHRRSERN